MRTNNNKLLESILEIMVDIDIEKVKKIVNNQDKEELLNYINKEYLT